MPNPVDVHIEEEFIACALRLAPLRPPQTLHVAEDDVTDPYLRRAWRTMLSLGIDGKPITRSVIQRAIEAEGADPTRFGAISLQWMDSTSETMLGELASTVRRQARAFRLWTLLAESAQSLGEGSAPEQIASQLLIELGAQDMVMGDDGVRWLADAPSDPEELTPWLFDGSIQAVDRVMVVGPAGSGKSVLTTQLAVCTALGFDPFLLRVVEPRPALIVNGENTEPYGWTLVHKAVQALLPWLPPERRAWADAPLAVRFLPDGLDIRNGIDYARLERWIAEVNPALVALGPLYGVGAEMRGRETAEEAANDFRRRMNRLVTLWEFALVMEHHGTKSDESGPANSHVYYRWPDVGITLVPTDRSRANSSQEAFLVEPYRGYRRARPSLPSAIRRPRPGVIAIPGERARPEPLLWMPARAEDYRVDELERRRHA